MQTLTYCRNAACRKPLDPEWPHCPYCAAPQNVVAEIAAAQAAGLDLFDKPEERREPFRWGPFFRDLRARLQGEEGAWGRELREKPSPRTIRLAALSAVLFGIAAINFSCLMHRSDPVPAVSVPEAARTRRDPFVTVERLKREPREGGKIVRVRGTVVGSGDGYWVLADLPERAATAGKVRVPNASAVTMEPKLPTLAIGNLVEVEGEYDAKGAPLGLLRVSQAEVVRLSAPKK